MSNSYSKLYLNDAQRNMACMIDAAVNEFGYKLRDFYDAFLDSRICDLFSTGDSTTLVGKSGLELLAEVMNFSDDDYDKFREIRFPFMHRAEYWTGWVIAYYQWSRGTSFKEIDKEIPIETIADMYLSYNERDITIIVDHINELIHNKA